MALLGPNAGLIGQPGSRAELCTPALVLEFAAFERNLGLPETGDLSSELVRNLRSGRPVLPF